MISGIQQVKASGAKEQAGRKQTLQAAAKLSAHRAAIAILSIAFLFFFGITTAKAQSSASASFTGFDTTSQGNWSGKYGSAGYAIANLPQSVPSYASFAQQGQQNWTWAASTSDARALASGSSRTATTWFTSSSLSMDINMTDGNIHQIAIYAVDFDRDGRSESFQVLDANSGALLDSRSISAFSNGTYAVWNVSGNVRVNVTLTGGPNAVVSGVFFGGSSAPATTSAPSTTGIPAAAQFLNSNTTAEGNWKSIFGADGYSIAGGSQKLPSYATLALQNQSSWTWVSSTSDPRALQGISGAAASTWYNTPSFSLDVNMTDGQTHQMALYALDWDLRGRAETIQILDANSGATLNTQSVTNFSNGIYLVWTISGHVKVNVTLSSGPNAVISGVFFGAALNANNPSSAFAPAITTQPASQTVTAGQSATFSVADTGTAPLTYQWMKNGVAISGANSSSYATPATATTDKGSQFSVTVSNTAGSVTSSAAVLTVNGGTLILNASTTALSFGQVNVSASRSQTVTLTNAGSAAVTISNVSVSGAGFNASGVSTGTVLAPGQSASLNASFAPAASGNATGSIAIVSNATSGTNLIALSGTATAPVPHAVAVSWSPSTSTVSGYNVYVSLVSGSGYTKLTSSPVPTNEYSDAALQTAQTRYYVVTSVNSNGVESGYSSEVTAIVP
jgi:hypothetical protein